MKKINSFKDFMSELMLENMSLRVSKFELILSKKLREILMKMNHKIASDLLALHRDPSLSEKFDRTFLDLGENPGDISFIMSNKIPGLVEPEITHGEWKPNPDIDPNDQSEYVQGEELPSLGDFEYTELEKNPAISDYYHIPDLHEIQFTNINHPVWHKFRTNQRATRVVNSLFPGKYPHNYTRANRPEFPDDVETFQDMFTAIVDENSKKIGVVNGEMISHFYDCQNYLKNTGTLGGSCMKDTTKAKTYLKLYVENPDKIQLVVLYPEGRKDKIIGRAILWKLDEVDGVQVDNKYYMDRIYTETSSDEFMFIEYAKKNGYFYKSQQQMGADVQITTPEGNKSVNMSVFVDSKNGEGYPKYPYLDTMQFYCVADGEVTNTIKSNKRYIQLTSTDGSSRSV